MRIGVIFVGFNTAQYIGPSLSPWIRARNMQLNGDQYVICAVSVPFVGFPNDEASDGTVEMLKTEEQMGRIDKVITGTGPMHETEARGAALDWLIGQGVEAVAQVDADEIHSLDDISRIFVYVKANPFVAWFKVSYINYVFDATTRLIEPFTPPRIHRIKVGALTATHFSGDNDIAYGDTNQSALANLTIPQSLAAPRHYSWMSDLRSKKKCAYQITRWNSCSYRWNDVTDRLEFNPDYYARAGRPLPEVARD